MAPIPSDIAQGFAYVLQNSIEGGEEVQHHYLAPLSLMFGVNFFTFDSLIILVFNFKSLQGQSKEVKGGCRFPSFLAFSPQRFFDGELGSGEFGVLILGISFFPPRKKNFPRKTFFFQNEKNAMRLYNDLGSLHDLMFVFFYEKTQAEKNTCGEKCMHKIGVVYSLHFFVFLY